MPPLPTAPGIMQATMIGSDQDTGREVVNILHVKVAAVSLTTINDLADVMVPSWQDYFVAATAAQYQTGTIRIDSLDLAHPFFEERTMTAPIGVRGNSAGPQISYLIKLNSGLRGRGKTGRIYLGPAQAPNLEGNNSRTTAAFRAAVDANMVTFQDALAGMTSPGTLAILHRQDGTSTPVNTLEVEVQVATQRRRNRK